MSNNDGEGLAGLVLDGRYLIECKLGHGAMGVVYKARHTKLARAVAIKVLHGHLMHSPSMVERFLREARRAAALTHRNLVGVLDVDQLPDGRHAMVSELVSGRSLAEVCGRPMPEPRVIALAVQICDGLHAAHRVGLVHRDLKPENIMIDLDSSGDEIPRIIDFGISLLRIGDEEKLTEMGVVMGTPAYMAPEQATGAELDHRCDLFALGVIMYELLAGKTPFDGSGVAVVTQNVTTPVPPISERAPNVVVDAALEAIVMKLLAKPRAERYAHARDVRDALEQLSVKPPVPRRAITSQPLEPIARPRRHWSCEVPIAKDRDDD